MLVLKSKSVRLREAGSALLEFAVGMPVLTLFLFGTADFGRLFYTSIEVTNAATAGAYYGSIQVANMTDTTGISNAAKNDAPDVSNLHVSSSVVCQDSNAETVSCSTSNAYHYVQVTASATFQTLFNYPLIPSSVSLSKTVMIRGQ